MRQKKLHAIGWFLTKTEEMAKLFTVPPLCETAIRDSESVDFPGSAASLGNLWQIKKNFGQLEYEHCESFYPFTLFMRCSLRLLWFHPICWNTRFRVTQTFTTFFSSIALIDSFFQESYFIKTLTMILTSLEGKKKWPHCNCQGNMHFDASITTSNCPSRIVPELYQKMNIQAVIWHIRPSQLSFRTKSA